MFDHCLHAMSADQSDVALDLMEKGPSDNAYAELKSTYLERRTPTTADRAVLQGLYLMLITNCLTLERGRCDV